LSLDDYGSWISLLREKDLIELWEVQVSLEKEFDTQFLKLEMKLTDDGLAKSQEIMSDFFRYVKLLKMTGPQEWFWKELEQLQKFNSLTDDDDKQQLQFYPWKATALATNMLVRPIAFKTLMQK